MRGRLSGGRLLVNRLMVMQNGQMVEVGLTDPVLDDPQHPYTQQLVKRDASAIIRSPKYDIRLPNFSV
ncbi:MAG: hypothetical protein ACFB12_11690 [Leptolyngbyaceae cyanobacterium]